LNFRVFFKKLISCLIVSLLELVDILTSSIVRFKGVDERIRISFFVNDCPTAIWSAFTLPINFIVGNVIDEGRRSEVKIHRVQGHQLRKHFGFGHLVEIFGRITVYKAATFSLMSMKINVHLKSPFLMLFNYILFDRVYSWMLLLGRIPILSIQIITIGIKPPVASGNSIRIQNGNDFENIVIQ